MDVWLFGVKLDVRHKLCFWCFPVQVQVVWHAKRVLGEAKSKQVERPVFRKVEGESSEMFVICGIYLEFFGTLDLQSPFRLKGIYQ